MFAFELAGQLFGHQPTDNDLACLAGALDGATVSVSARKTDDWG
ncbi:MAG: hypothetical protein ABI977_05240 [Acidobacteriota bacterium]